MVTDNHPKQVPPVKNGFVSSPNATNNTEPSILQPESMRIMNILGDCKYDCKDPEKDCSEKADVHGFDYQGSTVTLARPSLFVEAANEESGKAQLGSRD